MTNKIPHFSAAPAVAALSIVVIEAIRATAFGSVQLNGLDGFAVFCAVLGLLGTPLYLAGASVQLIASTGYRGWQEERPPTSGPRRVAWVVYSLMALGVLGVLTQFTVMKTAGLFNKAVYVGLAGALTAIASAAGALGVSRPIVRALTSLFELSEGRGPRWLDPTCALGASVWAGVFVLGGAFLAPIAIKSLHTVDLRPIQLLALWTVILSVMIWQGTSWTRRAHGTVLVISILIFVSCLVWTAIGLGQSQSRVASVSRDTLLTGRAMSLIARFGDADGDGVSRLFAGGDCNDNDPKIRPGVFDPPDDGVDQNCTGDDLVLKERRFPRPVRVDPGAERPWNVVFLTIDALRADMVEAHMPRLSALARDSVNFTNAYSHGAATYWSLASLMTSKMPSRLEMARDQTPVPRELLMTEVLRNAGWHTALFANVTVFFVRGLRQGAYTTNYDTSHFTIHGAKPGSAHMTDGILRHVDKWASGHLKPQRDKFFVWGHYYDPHDPYFEVPGFKAKDSSDKEKYIAIVKYVDREIGRLVDGLKSRGVWDKTVFVLTADHGDEFLEHGHRFHGSTLYEEMTHVPLILRVPQVAARRIKQPIGHVEVAPTLLDALGVKTPPAFEGRSRIEQLRTGKSAPAQPVFTEVFPDVNYKGHQVALRLGDLKLIHRLTDDYLELFDLNSDPAERVNLVDVHPEANSMRSLLGWYVDRHLFALAQGKSGAKVPAGSPPKPKRVKKRRSKRPPRKNKPMKAKGLRSPKKGKTVSTEAGKRPTPRSDTQPNPKRTPRESSR